MKALTAGELAHAASVKPVYAQRIIGELRSGKRTVWRGVRPCLIDSDPPIIALNSLPLEIREAVLAWDQMQLPLTPPPEQIKLN